MLLAGCGGSHAAPRIVSWADRPLPPYRAPEAQLVRYPTDAPPCTAAQLRLRKGRAGAALGNYLEELVIANAGRHACFLGGYPTLTGLDSSGARVTLHPLRGGTYFGQLVPANIRAKGHVYLELATSTACQGPTTTYHDVALSLPSGTVSSTELIAAECGLSMSRVGLPERYAQPRARPGTAGTLAARIALPRTVRRGGLLRFTVVLRNPTSRPVKLDPCPGYTQTLFAQEAFLRQAFALNCDDVKNLAPHARQRYAMELRVPPRASGLTKISWSLDTAIGPFAGGVVTVR